MNNELFNQYTKQIETLFMAPARAYATLAATHTQKLMDAQMDAVRTYSEIGVQQARAAMEIKDADALQQYAADQQSVAKDLGERVKADGEKVVALNQNFANEARKLVESSAQSASETTKETVEATKKAAKAG
ncbi:phasin family protein [Spiribacter vilamensis]|uniref:Phasin family protein n=1 Tax=Spiribacter vilamensis TaxID=531306 RepID=A0A4Q8D0B5_9GAMM|nr:phasin family protein [Spiribacter vilamensis]RZU98738.1 phasin family protein [Spiribacter vilamensis]TVO62239.1 phasin family protein [Spiribacter vilamensis]